MSKTISFKFRVPIYNDMVWVYIGDKESLILKSKTISKHLHNHLKEANLDAYEGAVHRTSNSIALLHMHKFPDTTFLMGILQHEIFHLVYGILDSIGLKLSYDSEEAYAYLTGYITEKIYNKLKP